MIIIAASYITCINYIIKKCSLSFSLPWRDSPWWA